MTNGEEPKKSDGGVSPQGETSSQRGADAPTATPQFGIPPQFLPPGIPPQAGSSVMALQLGFGMQQQNPETVRYITEFLSHDSNNRLASLENSGKRNHQFRMTTLGIGAGLVVLVVVVPLIAQLIRGDMTFVDKLLTSYLPVLGAVLLALFAGPKVSELFKG